ncbi:unnamed protein product [Timema podura]|uniref:Uncharacterized protein n=1 Tax=Timema podura TaxID=61482 RepID=A0ABN7P0X1_TIMPD|nr:unnamed protein product [Timema podura]
MAAVARHMEDEGGEKNNEEEFIRSFRGWSFASDLLIKMHNIKKGVFPQRQASDVGTLTSSCSATTENGYASQQTVSQLFSRRIRSRSLDSVDSLDMLESHRLHRQKYLENRAKFENNTTPDSSRMTSTLTNSREAFIPTSSRMSSTLTSSRETYMPTSLRMTSTLASSREAYMQTSLRMTSTLASSRVSTTPSMSTSDGPPPLPSTSPPRDEDLLHNFPMVQHELGSDVVDHSLHTRGSFQFRRPSSFIPQPRLVRRHTSLNSGPPTRRSQTPTIPVKRLINKFSDGN